MKLSQQFFIFFSFFFTPLLNAETAPTEAKWQKNMTMMGQLMGELLPELYSKNSNVEILKKDSKALSEISHNIKEGREKGKMLPPDDLDPTVSFLAHRLSEQTKYAYSAIQSGNVSYGKSLLRSVTSYCIACHTRHDKGPEFPNFPLDPKIEKLSRQEKAELFVATRQFDKGLEQYLEIIGDKQLIKKQVFEWEKAVKFALEVAVRVKKDPKVASDVIDKALGVPELPEFEKNILTKWKSAIEKWKKEPVKKLTSEVAIANEAKRLSKEARNIQEYPADTSAQIQFLRASATAHDLLRLAKSPKLKAEAFLTAGMAYQVLGNSIATPLHELYFEACIRETPHTPIAAQCFNRFQESVFFGYSGSDMGTSVPDEVQTLVASLKELSSVDNKLKPKK